jgi:hypothetical protein
LASPPAIGGTAAAAGSFTNLSYTGTLTGGTGVVNLGSGQFYKDASGNIGISTSIPSSKLSVAGIETLRTINDNGYISFFNSDNTTRSGHIQGAVGVFAISADLAIPMTFGTNSTERMRIDSSGNVGIGTSSPRAKLEVDNGALMAGTTSGVVLYGRGQSSFPTSGLGYFSLSTNNADGINGGISFNTLTSGTLTEKARIDSSGNVLIGTTTNNDVGMSLHGGANPYGYLNSSATSNTPMFFAYNGTTVGTISQNTTTTFYNVSSDKRLKDKIGFATSTDVIDNTIIYDYSWKANGLLDRGVFAQEAKLVKPIAVFEGTDELGENGLPTNPWQVDYSKYIPDLIVYCQQLKKSLEELNAKVTALQAQLGAK